MNTARIRKPTEFGIHNNHQQPLAQHIKKSLASGCFFSKILPWNVDKQSHLLSHIHNH